MKLLTRVEGSTNGPLSPPGKVELGDARLLWRVWLCCRLPDGCGGNGYSWGDRRQRADLRGVVGVVEHDQDPPI